MTKDLVDVTWKGEVIGQIQDLKIDHMHLYGTWIPSASPKTAEFTARMAEDEHVIIVEIGHGSPHWLASAEALVGGQIELLWQPRKDSGRNEGR